MSLVQKIQYFALIVGVSLAVMCCAPVSDQRPIDEQQLLEFYQVSNSGSIPNVTVRARRYADHVVMLAECSYFDDGVRSSSAVSAARTQCESVLSAAVTTFQSRNSWELSGLQPRPARWTSHVEPDNVLVLNGTVRLILQP